MALWVAALAPSALGRASTRQQEVAAAPGPLPCPLLSMKEAAIYYWQYYFPHSTAAFLHWLLPGSGLHYLAACSRRSGAWPWQAASDSTPTSASSDGQTSTTGACLVGSSQLLLSCRPRDASCYYDYSLAPSLPRDCRTVWIKEGFTAERTGRLETC